MDLVGVVAERIKKHVLGLGASEKEWRVLVIDQDTAELLHYSVPMSDVLAHNIAVIERLEEERVPSPDFTAIYFVRMNSARAKQIQKDFAHNMYPSVYVVSISPMGKKEEDVLEGLAKKAEKRRKKEKQVQFVYKTVIFDFIALSPDVFKLYSEHVFYTDKERYTESTGERLRGLCKVLGVSCTPVPVGQQTKDLARRVDTTGPGKLLIIERGVDMSTPLLHFFTFESLLWDLGCAGPGYVVEVEKESEKTRTKKKSSKKKSRGKKEGEKAGKAGKDKGKGTEEDESSSTGTNSSSSGSSSSDSSTSSTSSVDPSHKVEMNREHTVWESIKNTQLVVAHETLTALIKKTTKSTEKEKKGNIKRLVKAVQELPAQTRTLKEIKILMGLLEKCVGYFNENGIKEVSEVEQSLATGKTSEGKSFRSSAVKEVLSVLDASKLTKEEKYRMYLLLMLNYGKLTSKEERSFVEQGHVSEDKINEAKFVERCLFGRAVKPATSRKQAISRYVPVVHDILEGVVSKNAQACARFGVSLPVQKDSLSGESLRKREFVFRAPSAGGVHERKIIIVYFIGGVTIAEITEIREIAKNTGTCIIIGSTDVCSPKGFLKTIEKMGR
ncbi:syntaxin-binding protein 3 [Nematocida sp. AWRm77]|nr:syntaxin-binding protein 3 [Nematocida sp. AWRm77]